MKSSTYNIAETDTQLQGVETCSFRLLQEAANFNEPSPNETCSTNTSLIYPSQTPSVPAMTNALMQAYTVKLAVVSAIAGLVIILAVALVTGIVIMK